MRAKTGDWLVIERSGADKPARRGLVVGVRREDGGPPYVVHWLDSVHETLVYPGPDAHVVTARELADLDTRAAERARAVQAVIGAGNQ
ncbi:DUF1918 domain-containing protein [Umezawaea endophytica]|uniref:DUF1918 domain-containing protein n=1 Tax=Umezawaea endophytica TaxID=1654476 RepID=A0A9X2VVH7_9PSEU|nr:DUF1918 domain-containing protein [Umezawaea endophytica]MCS7483700.1 DUF1918 domain-containing protein [Umezawaea endophytica]